MKTYKLLLQIECMQLKNIIKRIVTNPKRLITYLLYFAFMIFIVVVNTRNIGERSSESMAQFTLYFGAGTFVLVAFMMFNMLKRSSLNFKLSEINLMFTGPIDPRKMLLFNLFKKIPLSLLTSAYTLVFLMSMFINSIDTSLEAIIMTGIGYAMVFLIIEPLSFSLFVLGVQLKKENLQVQITQIIFVIIGGILVYVLYDAFSVFGFNLDALLKGLNHNFLNYIPILGWAKYLILSAITGVTTKTYVLLVLMIISYLTFVFTTFYLGRDYYEDVIDVSEKRHKALKEARSGKVKQINFGFKKKRVKTIDDKKFAQALDWKRKLMVRKKDISLYFSFETVLLLLSVCGLRIFTGNDSVDNGLYIVAGAYIYMKFLLSSTSNIDNEIAKPYFFLIPDKGFYKIVQVLKTDLERVFINGSLMVLAHSILHLTFSIEWLLFPLALTLIIALFLFSGILVNLFLPNGDAKVFSLFLKMIQIIVLLLPSFVVSLIVGFIYESMFLALLSNVLINILLNFILLSLSDKIVARMELK